MIPEYRHDRCVPPSRECGSWWRLVDHLYCCMPGRKTQFGAKMGQKKAFQDILKNYFSCVKAKCFIALWNFLNKHVAYKIIKLEEMREIKWRSGISAPLFLTAWERRGMWLPQLTLVVGFPVHFLACSTFCRLSQHECRQGPGNLPSGILLTPLWQCGQIRGRPRYSAPACVVSALCCNALSWHRVVVKLMGCGVQTWAWEGRMKFPISLTWKREFNKNIDASMSFKLYEDPQGLFIHWLNRCSRPYLLQRGFIRNGNQ